MPLRTGAVAWFDWVLIAAHHVGTHTIAIGRVVAAGSEPGTPLIYGRRSFGELVITAPEPSAALLLLLGAGLLRRRRQRDSASSF